MLVGPGLRIRRQAFSFQLSRRNKNLLDRIFFGVAVDIDVVENVVGHKRSQLLKRLLCDAVVPEPDIAENRRVCLQCARGRLTLPADAARLDAGKTESLAR